MFLHKENQQLLWETLQKTPYLVEFTQKFSGHREEWFRSILEQFFTKWISQNGRIPINARELLEINKHALQFMVSDLKRVLGYNTSNPIPTNDIMSPYNVAEERKRKEDTWSTTFNQYQSEYNRMLEKPALPVRELPSMAGDDKIKNMDELLKEQAKMRDMDLTIYTPVPTIAPTSASVIVPAAQILSPNKHGESLRRGIRLKIMDEIENVNDEIENVNDEIQNVNDEIQNVSDVIENVHDEIKNVNFDTKMVRFDLQEREFTDSRGDLNEYSSASQ